MRESLASDRAGLELAGCSELTYYAECQPLDRCLSSSVSDRNTLQCAVRFD